MINVIIIACTHNSNQEVHSPVAISFSMFRLCFSSCWPRFAFSDTTQTQSSFRVVVFVAFAFDVERHKTKKFHYEVNMPWLWCELKLDLPILTHHTVERRDWREQSNELCLVCCAWWMRNSCCRQETAKTFLMKLFCCFMRSVTTESNSVGCH